MVKTTQEAADKIIMLTFEGVENSHGDSSIQLVMTIESGRFSRTFTTEMREVDGTVYTQNPITKEWEVYEAGDTIEADAFGQFESELLADLENIVAKTDYLAGEPVYRITGAVADDSRIERGVIWAGIDDLLVRKMRMVGHTPAGEFEDLVPGNFGEMYQSVVVRFSRFGEPLEIVTPPVKKPGGLGAR